MLLAFRVSPRGKQSEVCFHIERAEPIETKDPNVRFHAMAWRMVENSLFISHQSILFSDVSAEIQRCKQKRKSSILVIKVQDKHPRYVKYSSKSYVFYFDWTSSENRKVNFGQTFQLQSFSLCIFLKGISVLVYQEGNR